MTDETKNGLAVWVLIVLLLVLAAPYLDFKIDFHERAESFWKIIKAGLLLLSGLFVVRRFLLACDDLRHYKQEDEQRWREQAKAAKANQLSLAAQTMPEPALETWNEVMAEVERRVNE